MNILRAPLRIVARPTETEKAINIDSLPDLVLNTGLMLSTLVGMSIALVAVALENARRSREVSRAKELFLATMSHEIRTPMNGVLGAVELALSRTSDAEARSYLSLADQSGRTLLALLNNILDFSKIESGKLNLENVPFDLRREVQQVVSLLSPLAASKAVRISGEVDPKVPAAMLGDPIRLGQVLLNLASNALKFTAEGWVRLTVDVIGGSADCPTLEIRCTDTGIGIAPEEIDALFQPFVQADASTTRQFGGTGLGLAIVKQIVTLAGGTIECRSTPGHGTAFVVTLTFQSTTDDVASCGTTAANLPPRALGPLNAAPVVSNAAHATVRVLLAEDNPANQLLASAMLRKFGCAVETVSDGGAAVQRCTEEIFDLVFMDMQMPSMDGIEAARRIRAAENGSRRIPIVALTANASGEDELACTAAGMDGFLTKPIRMKELREAVVRFTPLP